MLKDLTKLKDLIEVAVKYSSRPVSLKIRIGHITENNLTKMKDHIRLYERCVNGYLDDNFEISYSFKKYKFMELRRNLIWLSKRIQGLTDLRIKISKTKTLEELNQIITYLN
ncbi:unnamed protein product [marine sediment metagenome]|uniref:DUS-like FMN-binding domain-containing protein n=1 Tax=marine sediment metagenome TaxID=412755 RepID=X1FW88_9ZZZZ